LNIAMLLDMAVAGDPERLAIGDRCTGLSVARLHRIAAGAASAVRASGARELVYAGLNHTPFPIALFAAAYAGVPLVPVNYRLSADALTELMGRLERPMVVADPEFTEIFADIAPTVLTSPAFLATGGDTQPTEAAPESADEPAVLLFTSGTTAAPKAAVLRHRHLTSYVLQTVEFASAAPTDAALISVPPYHIAGVGSVLSNIYAARRMVHLASFDPAEWLRLVRDEGVTSAMLVPTMLARIVEHLDGRPAAVSTLRSLAYGGARMPEAVLEAALQLFPDTGFVNAYGLTETSSTIALLGPDDHRKAMESDDPAIRGRLRSAGRMVPGVEAQIRAADGTVLPTGATGELWVRGPQVPGEYQGEDSPIDEEGWFHTRDLARFDAEGYLFIEGRADDTIIRGGENIAPAEIEDVLLRHPAVRDAGVVGVPDEEWGERIAAFVVLHEGAEVEPDELRSWARARLRGSKTPDVVTFLDALPYTPTGKLLRRQLLGSLSPAG